MESPRNRSLPRFEIAPNKSWQQDLSSVHNLHFFITQMISILPNVDTIEYEIAEFHFRQYVIDHFKAAKNSNEENYFIDELFVAVSLSQLSQNSFHYLALLTSLLEVNLGDKVSKANRIARDLTNIQPDQNPLLWKFLKKVLLWLNRSLRSSMQFIIYPLLEMGWKYCLNQSNIKRIAGMRMIRLILKNFPLYLESQFSQIISVIIENIKSSSPEVKEIAIKLVKSFIKFKNPHFHIDIITLCAKLNRILNDNNWRFYKGAIETSKVITTIKPELKGCFVFNNIPIMLFLEKDPEAIDTACAVVPFAVNTSSPLFSDNIYRFVFHQYNTLISKRSPSRKVALISLANVLFTLKELKSIEFIKIVKKYHSMLEDSLDSSSAVYALISIDSVITTFYKRDETIIFSRPLSKLMVSGLSQFILAHPDYSFSIHSQIIILVNNLLFNPSTSSAEIIMGFRTLISMNIEIKLLKVPLVIQMLVHLNSPNVEVREIASTFGLMYIEKTGSSEVAQIILSAVTSETNKKLRIKMIHKIKCPPQEGVIYLLHSLLHDTNRMVRCEALNSLSLHADDPSVSTLLSDFLMEIISSKQKFMPKKSLDYFLIVASHKDKTKNLLIPFSHQLVRKLIKEKRKLPSKALELLSQIIKLSPKEVDIDRLVDHILDSLLIHSTKRRLSASLDLLYAALRYTELGELIYSKHSQIYVELISVSRLSDTYISRKRLIRVLATIGAMKHSIFHQLMSKSEVKKQKNDVKTALFFFSLAESSDPYQLLMYAAVGVALSNLFNILLDKTLSALHPPAIEALLTILKVNRQMGTSLEAYLLKKINELVTNGVSSTVSLLLTNMSTIISVLGDRFSPLVPHVVDFICHAWTAIDKFLLLRITEWLMLYVPDDFRSFLPQVVTVFLQDFNSYDERTVDAISSSLVSFNDAIEDVDYIAYPSLLNWILYHSQLTQPCIEMLIKLRLIFISGGASKFTSLIVRTCVLTGSLNDKLQKNLLDVLCVVAAQVGKSFLIHLQKIKNVFDTSICPLFDNIINCLRNDSHLCSEAMSLTQHSAMSIKPKTANKSFALPQINKNSANQMYFIVPQKEFDDAQWHTWSTETFSMLLRSSNSRAISACSTLAERHSRLRDAICPLAYVLAFLQQKDQKNNVMTKIMDIVFSTPHVPRSVVRHLLASVELMEIVGIKIPVSRRLMVQAAQNVAFDSQAMRMTELLIEQDGYTEMIEMLVLLNQKLGLKLSAGGVLHYAKRRGIKTSRATLSESLGLWNEALQCYEERLIENPGDPNIFHRKLRCLQKLLKFDELRKESAGMGTFYEAISSWSLFDYDNFLRVMESEKSQQNSNINEYKYYRSIFLIMKDDYKGAKTIINGILDLPKGIFPMLAEDYERVIPGFSAMSNVHMLLEVIQYKKMKRLENSLIPYEREKAIQELNKIKKCWSRRFYNLTQKSSICFDFLAIESLVLKPIDIKDQWLRFINIAINQNDFSIAQSVINYLQVALSCPTNENGNSCNNLDELKVLNCRFLWARDQKDEAIKKLTQLSKTVSNSELKKDIDVSLGGFLLNTDRIGEAYSYLSQIKNVRAINEWSRVNLILYQKTKEQSYLVESFKSFLENICESGSSVHTLALQILFILFRQGSHEIYTVFAEKVEKTPLSCWIEIIPQMIARLSSPVDELRELLQNLIYRIGMEHPQTVIYSLLVPYKSDNTERRMMATSMFDKLRIVFPNIVDGVVRLADEFMRVAVSWLELVQTHLDDSSRAYFGLGNADEMIDQLHPVRELIRKIPETLYEISFLSQFGQMLQVADHWLDVFEKTRNIRAIHQAWQQLSLVFNRLRPLINSMNIIKLKDASPQLASLKNTTIAVPGTYLLDSPLVTIESFCDTFVIIKSKQRPRRMAIMGNDGQQYTFLLKAHEDTRLDERVMQLFGYINTLVFQSTIPLRSRLPIITYKVIPLTGEVGLIGWVPDCSTLFDVIKEYREKHNTQLEIEYIATKKFAPDYENLPINEKIIAFNKGLAANNGLDLRDVLFQKAKDSADWLSRRSTYTASLAITSMAGYILGLGDRHLCNIMMKSKTAKLVHIDFGDCFEVAMRRENYPEKVPIRLTRILVNALEMTKIDGAFRSCCENVLTLMRNNDEHILSLLEAFIYDPLMQWTSKEKKQSQSAVEIVERIKDKLSGNDFQKDQQLSVQQQVEALIDQATDVSNLCHMFKGWFPWW
ncbi:PIKK family atypical protein kinase [Tritrichomonas foetus]|uniref:non-specific serine/threonine protein kinase n=1 Tax=Tritrichomonas foetus TaxID=1144522 RepID=A0A1J4KBZ2_9EUKA|nr:PIKK family atypical protein kinase [Tritrichomonas foetus]|eukprot:OHT07190.1 PIKK family atypical protein kinase [Tritrichomonas foetus]